MIYTILPLLGFGNYTWTNVLTYLLILIIGVLLSWPLASWVSGRDQWWSTPLKWLCYILSLPFYLLGGGMLLVVLIEVGLDWTSSHTMLTLGILFALGCLGGGTARIAGGSGHHSLFGHEKKEQTFWQSTDGTLHTNGVDAGPGARMVKRKV